MCIDYTYGAMLWYERIISLVLNNDAVTCKIPGVIIGEDRGGEKKKGLIKIIQKQQQENQRVIS